MGSIHIAKCARISSKEKGIRSVEKGGQSKGQFQREKNAPTATKRRQRMTLDRISTARMDWQVNAKHAPRPTLTAEIWAWGRQEKSQAMQNVQLVSRSFRWLASPNPSTTEGAEIALARQGQILWLGMPRRSWGYAPKVSLAHTKVFLEAMQDRGSLYLSLMPWEDQAKELYCGHWAMQCNARWFSCCVVWMTWGLTIKAGSADESQVKN